jgi:hypothetical protein
MPLRPELQAVFDALLAAHPEGGITLDDLSDATWDRSFSYADIDELIAALEEAGHDLEGGEPPPRPQELVQALAAARTLTAETGKRPSVDEIATRSGLTPATVLRALRMGRAIGAPKD